MVSFDHQRASGSSRAPAAPLQSRLRITSPVVQRAPTCACEGTCPRCQAKSSLTVSQPNDPAEREADAVAKRIMRMPVGGLKPVPNAGNLPASNLRKCGLYDDKERPIQRKALPSSRGTPSQIPAHVHNAISTGGRPLASETRSFFEPRLGYDLSGVRIHIGGTAAASAQTVDAKAYTLGHDIIFGSGEYRPESESGNYLLAHELVHVAQQPSAVPYALHRTPASKVSCAARLPLVIPSTGTTVADPVGVITTAEDRANEMFDAAIDGLDFTRQQILAGASVGWPTISDALAEGLVLMGLDPDDPGVWTVPDGTGLRSVPLLLRRLRMIRRTIGAGSFFFFCDGTGMRTLGGCAATSGDICTGAVLTTCAGEFLTAMCPPFWDLSGENQAARIVHESAHNFATFIGHTGRFTNAECFARLAQVYAGVPVAEQRTDLCPDP
jgi:hypothetical protein